MKKIGLFIAAAVILISCGQNPNPGTMHEDHAEPVTDGVFIHISEAYNDAHRALMPLKMATIMAEDKDVIIYFDIHAVKFLVKGSEDVTHEGFESAHTYLKQLVEKQVGLYACPACMNVAGIAAEDLMDGIQTAQKDKFFDFTKGRILTLDY
jgi:predicted peroxiredoxin